MSGRLDRAEVLGKIVAILFPTDEPERSWSPDTLDEIVSVLNDAGLVPGEADDERQSQIDELAERVEDAEVDWGGVGLLDELIHEAKSEEASQINNGGYEAQVAFLFETFGPKQARAEIEQRLADIGGE